MDNKFV